MRAAIQKEGPPNVRKGCTTLKQKVTQRAPILCFYRMSVSGTERQAYSVQQFKIVIRQGMYIELLLPDSWVPILGE